MLATKVGYGIDGQRDWTASRVPAGVDEALRLTCTEHIDIVHLHSCELPTLLAGEAVDALDRAQALGKIGLVAYSGENEALAWSVASGRFGGIEGSVNLFDQGSLGGPLALAAGHGLGVIAKRPLAYDTAGLTWNELALRFSAFQPGVSAAIVGTASVEHLRHNVRLTQKGPLPGRMVDASRAHRRPGRRLAWRGLRPRGGAAFGADAQVLVLVFTGQPTQGCER